MNEFLIQKKRSFAAIFIETLAASFFLGTFFSLFLNMGYFDHIAAWNLFFAAVTVFISRIRYIGSIQHKILVNRDSEEITVYLPTYFGPERTKKYKFRLFGSIRTIIYSSYSLNGAGPGGVSGRSMNEYVAVELLSITGDKCLLLYSSHKYEDKFLTIKPQIDTSEADDIRISVAGLMGVRDLGFMGKLNTFARLYRLT